MDVISLLKADHKEVNALFIQVEAASDRAVKTKQKLFSQISAALTVHAAAEEQILYPRMRELPELRANSFEAGEEHRLVKQLIAELSAAQGEPEEWDAKMKVLIDLVRHHVREEETEYFKVLKRTLKKEELRQLGEAILAFKQSFKTSLPRATPESPLAHSAESQA